MEETSRNIILFRSDEHNPKYSSSYGHPFIKTPNMDKLAKNGVLYEYAYCNSPLCVPSRSSFLSGKYVHEIQTYNNCQIFEQNYPSYGKVLKNQGIHTAYIGKVHTYTTPRKLDFSEMMSREIRKKGDQRISRSPLFIREGSNNRQNGYGIKVSPAVHDSRRIKKAIKWLKKKGNKLTNKKKNWILDINVSKPHFPHYNTNKYWDMYEGYEDMPEFNSDVKTAQHPYAQDLRDHFETHLFKEENIKKMRRGYYGVVSYMDSLLGQVMDTVDNENLSENTLIVYTSDHGEMLGKFGMWWKCCLFEDSIRVPLIMAGPGIDKNKRISIPVSLLDLQATLFDYFNCKRPNDWKGKSLFKISNEKNVAFSEYHGHGTRGSAYMIRKEDWKYIYYEKGPNQLFNIKKDPEELNNQLNNEHSIPIAKDFENELRNICDPEFEDKKAEEFIQKQMKQIKIGKIKKI